MPTIPKSDPLESEHALLILKELEASPHLTQRDLAHKFSLSLGKVNYLLKALINKGIIEATNFTNARNKSAYMYLLTAAGIRKKVELTRKFFEWKLQEYGRLKKEIARLEKEMAKAES